MVASRPSSSARSSLDSESLLGFIFSAVTGRFRGVSTCLVPALIVLAFFRPQTEMSPSLKLSLWLLEIILAHELSSMPRLISEPPPSFFLDMRRQFSVSKSICYLINSMIFVVLSTLLWQKMVMLCDDGKSSPSLPPGRHRSTY